MFHWICPECGREIAPSMKECPACDPSAAVPVAAGAVTAQVALTPEVVSTPASSSAAQWDGACAVIVDAEPEPALSAKAEPHQLEQPEPHPPELSQLELHPLELQPADLHPPEPPQLELHPPEPPQAELRLPEPPPPATAAAPASQEPPVQRDPLLALAEAIQPGPLPLPGWLEQIAGREPKHRTPVVEPQQSPAAPVQPSQRPHSPQLSLAEAAAMQPGWTAPACAEAVPRGQQDYQPAAPQPPQQPALKKACAAPALAELCYQGVGPDRVQPTRLNGKPAGAAAPRITLAGPTLPPELVSLQAAGISAPLTDVALRPSTAVRMPGWMVSLIVAIGLAGVSLAVALYLMPGMQPETAQSAAPPAAPRPASSPLAQYVEVTGFRFVTDTKRNPEIHYLVVNHSPALLNGVTVYVTLRSRTAQASQPPLSQFSFKMPNLGPYESREMTSAIEKVNRPGPLPDWRDLIVQVDVAP